MRRLLLAIGLSVCAVGCSSSTSTDNPTDACNSVVNAGCNKASACNQLTNGVTVQQCITAAEAAAGCATIACPTGKTFNSGNASSCVNAVNAQSCTDFGNNVTPTVCNTVCQ